MNKTQLKEYLQKHFEVVLENKNDKEIIEENKIKLFIDVGSIDDKCYVWISEFIAKNSKNEYFYFVYYGKKNTTLFYDDDKKYIGVRLPNNVTERYKYELFLKKVKKILPTSNSYVIFFSNDKVLYNSKNKKSHIILCNEDTIESLIFKHYDF